MTGQSKPPDSEASIPIPTRPAYDAVVALTDAFCRQHLNAEYQALCRRLATMLARKRPSPLTRGKPEVWACALVRVIGWVNFLDDRSNSPHLKLTAIDHAFGVAESTGQGKAKAIRDMLKIRQFDFRWMLRKRIEESPMVWMIEVNGLPLDARHLRQEIQEEAYRKGLIPYIPDKGAEDAAEEDPAKEATAGEVNPSAAADTACLVGELHLRKGEFEKAAEAFTRAIENNPTVDAYQGRAQAYRALAEKDEEKAREQAPKRDEAALNSQGLNEEPEACPLQRVLGSGPSGQSGLSRVSR